MQLGVVEGILIGVSHSLKAINPGVEDVAIHRKAMGRLVVVRSYSASESVELDLLVCVVKLKN